MKFCHNCGSYSHKSKECKEPITSCGLILVKLPYYKKINLNSYIKIDNYNDKNLGNLMNINKYMNKIKFLLVRRKHSLNYIEFIRGKYTIDKDILTNIFELMSPDEIANISIYPFKKLWEDLWKDKSWSKSFQNEYKNSEIKFNQIKDNKELFKYLTRELVPKYNSSEWGMPKGRRESMETNLECGIREFCEETSLKNSNFNIINKLFPIDEIYTGTNNKNYKSSFYLATLNRGKYNFNISNNLETGEIGFFTLNEAIKLIRDYHHERITILQKVFLFLINILENNSKNINL